MKNNSPLDKGRVVFVAEKYPTNQLDQQNQPILKNRYATVGRATLWPTKAESTLPNVEIEIDTLPVGHTAPLKLYIFWDSENTQNTPPVQQSTSYPQASYPQASYPQAQPNAYAQQRG